MVALFDLLPTIEPRSATLCECSHCYIVMREVGIPPCLSVKVAISSEPVNPKQSNGMVSLQMFIPVLGMPNTTTVGT